MVLEGTMRPRDQSSKPDDESPEKASAGERTSFKRKSSLEAPRPKRLRTRKYTTPAEDSGDETEAFASDNSVYDDFMPNQLEGTKRTSIHTHHKQMQRQVLKVIDTEDPWVRPDKCKHCLVHSRI